MNLYTHPFHQKDISDSTFLITGGAGFIGSNIADYLLTYGVKKLIIMDNFSTGSVDNIKHHFTNDCFQLIEGDIRNIDVVKEALRGVDFVLHQAALGSVPRSVNDPITTNDVNIGGFLNVLTAAKDEGVKKFVFAASSSTYGDHPGIPKVEDKIGAPLSPYAVTKYVNELYAKVFDKVYKFPSIGLRYFNVFGPKQNPNGEYAAVIPRFIKAALSKNEPIIFGDGEQTRDFTFVSNVVQANIKAVESNIDTTEIFNIACAESTTLNALWQQLCNLSSSDIKPFYKPERSGDIKNSKADISKASLMLDYKPIVLMEDGIKITYEWFLKKSIV